MWNQRWPPQADVLWGHKTNQEQSQAYASPVDGEQGADPTAEALTLPRPMPILMGSSSLPPSAHLSVQPSIHSLPLFPSHS